MMRTEGWKEIENRQLSEYGYQIKAQVLSGFTRRQAGFSVVLLGDSLTDYGEWSEFEWADNIQIYNRGIAGDTCRGMRDRLDSIEKLSPDCLFLMAGINNLSVAQPLYVAEREYKLLVETIIQKLPNCQKYIFSILPINNQIYKNRHIPDNTMIIKFNEFIRKFANEKHIPYLDLYAKMINSSGLLEEAFTVDGCHLSAKGYQVWYSVVRQVLLTQGITNKG